MHQPSILYFFISQNFFHRFFKKFCEIMMELICRIYKFVPLQSPYIILAIFHHLGKFCLCKSSFHEKFL